MDQKIQLIHPAGKKAVRIDKGKYDVLKKAIINFLKTNGESTHAEILHSITENFEENKTKFEGSVEWHLEWVKLDLEARKEIKRISDKTPIKFMIAGQDNKINYGDKEEPKALLELSFGISRFYYDKKSNSKQNE